MARKTPAKIIALIKRHDAQMEYITEILRVKRTVPVENQAAHVRYGEDYWKGLAHGYSGMLENALHEHGCYAGFCYVGSNRMRAEDAGESWPNRVGIDDPDYESWRVSYQVRS